MSGDSLRTQIDGESVFERFAAEAVGSVRSRRGESAGASGAVRGEQPVGLEDLFAAAAHGADGAGGAALWPTQQGDGGGGRPTAFLDSAATRLDAGRTAAAALGETAISDQHRAAMGCAAGTATATQKKSLHAQEQDTPEARQRRQAWREQVSQIDPGGLVFLDASGVTTEMTRR